MISRLISSLFLSFSLSPPQDTPKNIANLQEEVREVDTKLSRKVDQERKERMDDFKDLRGEVDRIVGKNQKNASTVPSLVGVM